MMTALWSRAQEFPFIRIQLCMQVRNFTIIYIYIYKYMYNGTILLFEQPKLLRSFFYMLIPVYM